MRILLLAENIGGSAPGLVFRNIAEKIFSLCELDIMTAELNEPSTIIDTNHIVIVPLKRYPYRIRVFEFTWLGVNLFDKYWAWQVASQINGSYDIVLSCISFSHFAPLLAGEQIAHAIGCKHVCYCVDAVPAPVGWLRYDYYYKSLARFVNKHMSNLDALCMTNLEMLEYQTHFLKPTSNIKKIEIYNPTYYNKLQYLTNENPTGDLRFLYVGQIYPPRTPKQVLKAFEKLVDKYDNVKLTFLGTRGMDAFLDGVPALLKKHIEILPYQKNPEEYYKSSIALLDINADIKPDVFLSSKITSYLCYNRIIICESNIGSPASRIFKGFKSIVHCTHDPETIYQAMIYAMESYENMVFEERQNLIRRFSADAVSKRLIYFLENEI